MVLALITPIDLSYDSESRGSTTFYKLMFHRNWCIKAVIALRNDRSVEPYNLFMSGPSGVGKSHVIHSDTAKLSSCFKPSDVTALVTAPI